MHRGKGEQENENSGHRTRLSMGLLYGAKLSDVAQVSLIGRDEEKLKVINEKGITLKRGEDLVNRRVRAYLTGTCQEVADVVLLFTKAYQLEQVLEENRGLIREDTLLLTLQNGAGHERVLSRFADWSHVLVGTTKQGSYRESACVIVNSGLGETVFGGVAPKEEMGPDPKRLEELRSLFEKAGFPCRLSENIRFEVWDKLMINASSSVLSGVLLVPQGYVAENEEAWSLCEALIHEICAVAAGEGAVFEPQEQVDRVRKHLRNAPGGYTSIYGDLKNGRKTEVDFICGAVLRAAQEQGMTVPTQEMILRLVHALEERKRS